MTQFVSLWPLQNSPLFQYLQDLGHTDFEACSPVSQEEEPSAGGEEAQFPQDILPSHRVSGGVWRLVDALRSLNPLRRDSATRWQEQQLDAAFRQYSLRCLLSQDVLLQEDVELIELLDPSVLSLGSTDTVCPSASTSVPAPRYLSPPSIRDVSVLVGLLAVLLGVCFSYPDHEQALWLCVVLVCVTCACRGLSLWRKAVLQQRVQSLAVQLEGLVNNSRALTSLSRKSLRLIQETEVISRGFTLVSGACPFNRAGLLRSQQLIGLRKAAYQSLRCAFRASRLATCVMLKSYPDLTTSFIDNVTNYVSTVPIRELGLGLGVEHLSDDQAQELTSDYSLPALKMLFQLWVGQSSEFFRRLALLLSPGREELDSRPSPLTYSSVPLITDALHRTLAACLGDLQRSFDFHRYFETQHQSLPSERNGRAQQKCRELNSLHTSVRSLQLHLKTLLNEYVLLRVYCFFIFYLLFFFLQPCETHINRMLCICVCSTESSDQPEETAAPDPPPPAPFTHIQDRDPIPEEQVCVCTFKLERNITVASVLLVLEKILVFFVLLAALAPFAKDTSKTDTNSLEPHISAESMPTVENHVSQQGEEDECEPQTETLSGAERERDSVTEFCCGDSDVTGAAKDTRDETAEETQLFQSDGLIDEGHDGTHPLTPRVPTLSVIDRLTELHGSEAISFSSALAAQVAARSHTFTHMQECTYEDSEEEEEVTSPQTREPDED
uniref:Vezatin n=1 Tax=Cyprinus carpio TaxID=7962 RepID=A0A8C2GUR0_CYPCA